MVRAKRSLGQNFLVDANYQRRIASALHAGPTDDVLEIGPGTGALTQHLAGHVRQLVIVELDDDLAAALTLRYAADPTVRVLHRDFMTLTPEELGLAAQRCLLLGNIPYNITTPLLFRVLERAWRPRDMVLMVQREVADRITAPPGERVYGALSVGVRTIAAVKRLFTVPRGAFRPAPKVDSAVLRITPFHPAPLTGAEERDLRVLTRTTFAWRRKQLQRILRAAAGYQLDDDDIVTVSARTGLDMQARPETLSPAQFVELSRVLRALDLPAGEHS